MIQNKRLLGLSDGTLPDWFTAMDFAALNAMVEVEAPGDQGPNASAESAKPLIKPTVLSSVTEVQLDAFNYGATSTYGSNFATAWRYSSGAGVAIGLVDDGFDPSTTALYGNFSTALSRNFGVGAATAIGEPSGGFHGTTTSGMIGSAGLNGMPMGLAPNAEIIGSKVTFGNVTMSTIAAAEQYAASVASVVNNSWGFTGYGSGEPNQSGFAVWYSAVQWAVQNGRGGLGSIIVFAAGNDRTDANNLAVQPVTADYREIAVAATDANGTVAYYSTPGAALLVSAIGDNVAVPVPGGFGYGIGSGTSYAAPTVSAVVGLMLSVNPNLGWRDVQTILAASAYVPRPSAAGFVTNGATFWNGGGMHFSNDLGFGVIDANVAVNLARAWTLQSTSANMMTSTQQKSASFAVGVGATVSSTLNETARILVQHVQVTINDTYLPVADTNLVLISPDGTKSVLLNQAGLVNGLDETGGLDVSGSVITSNAFWGEQAAGTWTLQVQDIGGATVGTIKNWSLTVIGDNATTVADPLVYTPEFATLAAGSVGRTVVTPGNTNTIDLIALPGTTMINLNGGVGTIDGVAVTVKTGLKNAYADGSTGSVTLTGLSSGGSTLSGGDGTTVLTGYGRDTIDAGLGTTTIYTGSGGSAVTLSSLGASNVTIRSGGGDTIWAGVATANVSVTGSQGDTIFDQGASLRFINGAGSSTVEAGTGTVIAQSGAGGGVYYAGTGGNSMLTAGTGQVTFYGGASGDVLTAAGTATDTLIAGAGNETLKGGTATGTVDILGGSGADILVGGLGNTTFAVGTGNDAITVAGLADIIQIQSGHAGGLDTVSGFRLGTDFLHLVGFASTAGAAAQSGAISDGHGGTLLQFSDNTRIDLLGVGSLSKPLFS